jgi:prepilin-type N-terminal cleavage/methylation domain-containing protein
MRRTASLRLTDHFGLPIARQYSGRNRRTGFSLLELLVVVAILVLLAALVAPNVIARMQESRVAHAAESVRDVIARSRTFALDAGIDYQFRYESNGRNFVVLPLEMEPVDSNSTFGDSETFNYVRLTGELDDGLRLLAIDDDQRVESLETAWFGQLANSLQLSQAAWSSPIIFRFDGTADDAEFQVTTADQVAADLTVRGLTGSVSVSRVYREAD